MKRRVLKAGFWLGALVALMVGWARYGGAMVHAMAQEGETIPPVASAQQDQTDEELGMVIVKVEKDGPADVAGVSRGDILLALDASETNSVADLRRLLAEREEGDAVELRLLHGDEEQILSVILGERRGRAYLGLTPYGEMLHAAAFPFGDAEAVIREVVEGSPAAEAGLQEGDRIVAVDGVSLEDGDPLSEQIGSRRPGDSVTLRIERGDEEPFDVTIVLGNHPDMEGRAFLGVRYAAELSRRLQLGLPGDESGRLEEGFPPFAFDLPMEPFGERIPRIPEGVESGIVLNGIVDDSPAASAGLQDGDIVTAIDGEPVEGPRSLSDTIAERSPGDTVTLTIFREDEEAADITVTLGEREGESGEAYLGIDGTGFFWRGDDTDPGGSRGPGNLMRQFDFPAPEFDFPLPARPWDDTGPELMGPSA